MSERFPGFSQKKTEVHSERTIEEMRALAGSGADASIKQVQQDFVLAAEASNGDLNEALAQNLGAEVTVRTAEDKDAVEDSYDAEPTSALLEELRSLAGVGAAASPREIASAFIKEYESQGVDPIDALPQNLSPKEANDVMGWMKEAA